MTLTAEQRSAVDEIDMQGPAAPYPRQPPVVIELEGQPFDIDALRAAMQKGCDLFVVGPNGVVDDGDDAEFDRLYRRGHTAECAARQVRGEGTDNECCPRGEKP